MTINALFRSIQTAPHERSVARVSKCAPIARDTRFTDGSIAESVHQPGDRAIHLRIVVRFEFVFTQFPAPELDLAEGV